jgi:hypothetical protein
MRDLLSGKFNQVPDVAVRRAGILSGVLAGQVVVAQEAGRAAHDHRVNALVAELELGFHQPHILSVAQKLFFSEDDQGLIAGVALRGFDDLQQGLEDENQSFQANQSFL